MNKLEKIPKKQIYTVPEGYFDNLPSTIQARVAADNTQPAFRITWAASLKYALPALLIAVAGLFWLQQEQPTIDEELDGMAASQLAFNLTDNDLTTDELIESVNWSMEDVDLLEENVFASLADTDEDIDLLIDGYELEIENF